jgi:anti-anti-sigma regulatory factor
MLRIARIESELSSPASARSSGAGLSALESLICIYRRGSAALLCVTTSRITDEGAWLIQGAAARTSACYDGRLAVDLSLVHDFTCSWINSMLEIDRVCWQHGGRLSVFGMRREMRDILALTGLAESLDVQPDEETALKSIGAWEAPAWQLAVAKLTEGRLKKAA